MNEDEKRGVLSNRFVVDPIEVEVDNSEAEGKPFDFSVEGDAYISLAEAWALFCEKEAPPKLFDPLASRPHNGPGYRGLVHNPDTWELEAEPIDGADYKPGMPDGMCMDRVVAAFRERVVLKLRESAFCDDGAGVRSIAFRDLWPECESRFFDSYVHHAPDLRDGGPKSWDAIRPATSFPIAVNFDRAAFEALEVVKKWAEPEKSEQWSVPLRSRRGRPPKFDWTKIEAHVFRLMDYHGDFTVEDPRWGVQARLEEQVKTFCMSEFGAEPADGTLRERRLPEFLKKWRENKAAGK